MKAMNETQKYLNSVAGKSIGIKRNTPKQYGDRQHRYMRDRNALFAAERAQYSSDYFLASVQGLQENIYEYTTVYIRLADVTSRVDSQAMKTDDFKQVLFKDTWIDYIPLGSKIEAAGSVWLATNPANISAANAKTVVTRCNASYNSYDDYGNVITEPVYVENAKMLSNETDRGENLILMAGYFKITAQHNENTSKIRLNQRIILGTQPYYITGVQDFLQEFTGDRQSARIVTFTARVEEPTEYDDIDNDFVAGGKTRSFQAEISGAKDLFVGASAKLTAHFIVDGEEKAATAATPITWEWQTDDENVLSVDENGNVTAIGEGTASVSATLAQNQKITASCVLTVTQAEELNVVAFKGVTSDSLKQNDSVVIHAAYYEDLEETDNALEWSFGGAPENDYEAVVAPDGKSVTITCLSASETDLQITASYEAHSATMALQLMGY